MNKPKGVWVNYAPLIVIHTCVTKVIFSRFIEKKDKNGIDTLNPEILENEDTAKVILRPKSALYAEKFSDFP